MIYPGYDLKIESAEKGAIQNKPFEEITIRDGLTLSTRKLAEGETDYLNGVSAGNSGKIYLEAEQVDIGKNVRILAHVEQGSTFTAGDITINSHASSYADFVDMIPGIDIDTPEAIIKIGEGVIIKGKAVSFTAEADTTEIFSPEVDDPDLLRDTGALDKVTDILKTIFEKTIGIVEDFSLVGGVAVAKATSLISISTGSQIIADSFAALSASYIAASASPVAIAVGVAVGVGISNAQVIVDGTIITAGDCTLKSLADNTLNVEGASGGLKGFSAGVAVSVLVSTSKVSVGGSAGTSNLQVGGNLTIDARTIDRNRTFARSTTDENGKAGLAIAFSYEEGLTEACLAGTVDVLGDIVVGAYMIEEGVEANKLFLFPSIEDGVYAYSGANINVSGDHLTDIKGVITGKISGFAKKHIKEFINKYILEKKDEIEEKSGSQVSSFELAAAIAVYVDSNEVKAYISPNANVRARGAATVHALAENQPNVIATGSVDKSENDQTGGEGGTGPNPGEDPEEETKFAGAAAIAVAVLKNNVTSYIGTNAHVDAAKDLTVKADYINDYEFKYGIELIKYLIGDFYSTDDKDVTINRDDIVEVKDGHTAGGEPGNLYKYLGGEPLTNKDLSAIDYTDENLWEDLGSWWKYQVTEFITHLTTYLDDSMGVKEIFNFWVQSNAAGAQIGACGSISVVVRNNSAEAYIDQGVKINQIDEPAYRTGTQNVKVQSNLIDEIVYFSGNIELPGFNIDTKQLEKMKFKFDSWLGGEGTSAKTAAAGGSVIVFIQNNTSKAEIRDQVNLYANNLDVTSDTKVLNVVISAAGGQSEKFGLEGTFTWLTVNNQTIAQILNGARVVVLGSGPESGKVVVKANDYTYIVNVAGVIAVSQGGGGNIGIGSTGGYNGVSRDTQAVIGSLHDSTDGSKPGEGELTVSAKDVQVEAQNDGFIISVAVAGTYAGTKTDPKPENKKEAPQNGGSYGVGVSAEVVINNIQDKVLAYIRQASLNSTNLVIASHNRTLVIAVGGSAAIVTKDGKSAGLAGSFALNRIANKTKAFIEDSKVTATEKVEITAEAEERIIAVAASGSGETSTTSGGVAGQVSINTIASEVVAGIFNQANVTAKNITLTATDRTMIIAVAGALNYGGKAGIGAAIALNDIPIEAIGDQHNAVKAYIDNSTVNVSNALKLTAEANNLIIAVASAIGASKEGMSTAISVTVNIRQL
ncbi:MAG TPA: hypothetical protein GXX46_10735 [Peptococcaceae bacterium]|nr:hypothetical protein [Peptococcaceae bacterium]